MRGGKINRGVFSVESIKNNIMDLYDRAKNPLETLDKMQQDRQRTQEERFDYFINALKMDTESR
jgi:hypothetical protein